MRSNRMLVGVVTVAALALGSLPAASGSVAAPARGARHEHGHHADGDAVRAWNDIAVATLTGLPGPAGGAPPAAAIHVAMVQAAVFDALNAIGRRHFRPYLLWQRYPWWSSADAAVAAAAHGVLHGIVDTVPNVPDATRATVLATLATRYADALAAIPDGAAEAKGVAAGEAAAAAMLADRADDGRFGPSPWELDPAPGHWAPLTDPVTQQPIQDPTPWVGEVDPFALSSSSQFRTRGPLDLHSAQWAREYNEVKALGAVDSTVRTPEQTYIARWWQSTPVRSWNEVGRELSARGGDDALHTARQLALQNLSGADGSITCWNDKYHWDFWRPWNAIARAAEDGNPATVADPTWAPLIAAPYPDHPSGHLCLDAAHVRVLWRFFGDRIDGGFPITSVSTLLQPGDATVREFDRFSEVLGEVVEARIWAGLHFRTADRQGLGLGLRVGSHVLAHELVPLGHHHHHG